jgi:NAD+ synthase
VKIFIGQINPTVGALASNAELIRRAYDDGVKAGADLVMVPELAVTGYPPLDLPIATFSSAPRSTRATRSPR